MFFAKFSMLYKNSQRLKSTCFIKFAGSVGFNVGVLRFSYILDGFSGKKLRKKERERTTSLPSQNRFRKTI